MLCVSLSNIMLIFFSVEEIEGVSLPKKKENVPGEYQRINFSAWDYTVWLYRLKVFNLLTHR